jgi:hypothetical protein
MVVPEGGALSYERGTPAAFRATTSGDEPRTEPLQGSLANQDKHRPYMQGGPMLTGLSLREGPMAVRILICE